MIYEVKKDDATYRVDDNVLFDRQPKNIRELIYSQLKDNDADFDNCSIIVMPTRRIVITEKLEEDGTL